MNARTTNSHWTRWVLSLAAMVLFGLCRPEPAAAREDGPIPNPDPDPTPFPEPDPAVIKLTLHPKAAEILEGVMQGLNQKSINVALIGGETFMVGDCLGLKVSAGSFELALGYATFRMGTWGAEIVFTIDHISVSALKFRMKPSFDDLEPCDWSGATNFGGTINDIRLTIRFDPLLHLDDCHMVSLGDFEARASIGGVNLSGVQNDLETAAKNLIEDGVTNALNVFLPAMLSEAINGSFLNGICMTKLALYEAYMAFLGLGVGLSDLPEEYVRGLQPFYPTVDLRTVKFGHSDRQPPGNTTTDCNRIYFSDHGFVERLKDAALSSDDWDLLFHELQHTEQCAELGGREDFAKRWFRDFEISALVLNLSNPSAYYTQLHANMPLEQDAFDAETRIAVIDGIVREHASADPAPGVEVTAVAGPDVVARDTSNDAGECQLFLGTGTYDLRLLPPGASESFVARDDLSVSGGQFWLLDLELPAAPSTATFIRGNSTSSGDVNISDALATLSWLFSGGPQPPCLDAADVNDSGEVNLADPLALLNHLFLGAAPPPPPYPSPGVDPTPDALPCGDGG